MARIGKIISEKLCLSQLHSDESREKLIARRRVKNRTFLRTIFKRILAQNQTDQRGQSEPDYRVFNIRPPNFSRLPRRGTKYFATENGAFLGTKLFVSHQETEYHHNLSFICQRDCPDVRLKPWNPRAEPVFRSGDVGLHRCVRAAPSGRVKAA